MKMLVLSDSHGNVENMARAVEQVQPDRIAHLGDVMRDGEKLHALFPAIRCRAIATWPLLMRRKNCYLWKTSGFCFATATHSM